ncbi:class I adenylate cyclase [Pseudomonas cremoricolorata]|uniref:Adenylate cyclase n=1 Tax=Pseudomonas cremoricolorata TaxID=157783 RepID=A0A089WI77_9PSED|nr:class I adenylate cyclase [Pseudomonas cremoricolorata]AIR89005.1 adenylate cyclase [Pseudomonas cremoricolorata]
MNHPHEIRPDLEQGIDRKVLAALRERFLQLSHGRLARAREGLSTRQQQVLTLLPLLLHINHPLLPGYVSGMTPAGIAGFLPSIQVLAEVQRLTRTFSYKPYPRDRPCPLTGLYLMGSMGTLAQAEQSDMDLWLCHSSTLSDAELDELRRKCALLELWAAGLGAEAHLFLIDCTAFARGERAGELGSDDCGSTQHFLLLDEFYRTAIWLAGRTPLWWLVPVYEEGSYYDYAQALLNKRFIRPDDHLDLGHLAQIPPGEFLGAGLWQLYKGIDSPYKSLLKLLLIETYASDYPQSRCLGLDFKQAVFANQLDLDELDPYVMVYRRIERYLVQRHEPRRLERVRRSLYLKVNLRLSAPDGNRPGSWQRALMRRLTAQWGWDEPLLRLLDSRAQWKVGQVAEERRERVTELRHSYRFLTSFAQASAVSSRADQRDLNVLGRRLYAAFERRAGKIEVINPGIAPDLAEDTLTLVHAPNRKAPGSHHWSLYSGSLGHNDWPAARPIKRCHELIELLTWAYRNGVIDSSSRLAMHPSTSDLTELELFNLLGALQQAIALPLPPVSDVQLLQPSVATEVLLLVNVALDPLRLHRDLNILMTTERTDSLCYAGVRENLVLTIDQVTLNSWNEVLVRRYDGEHALLCCLRDYLNGLDHRRPRPRLRVRCFCHNRAQAITQRVEELLDTLARLLAQDLDQRYLLQVAQTLHVFELRRRQVRLVTLDDHDALLSYLGQERSTHSVLYLDGNALQEDDLGAVLPEGQAGVVQVFYRLAGRWAWVYVLDEYNALWRQRLPCQDEEHLLRPLHRFLCSIGARRNAHLELDIEPGGAGDIRYYQLLPEGAGKVRECRARPLPVAKGGQPGYEVQALVQASAQGRQYVTLYCEQQEYSQLEHGEQLYALVARLILEQRRSAGAYRCYITDLDLSGVLDEGRGSLLVYLRHKQALENALDIGLTQVQADPGA